MDGDFNLNGILMILIKRSFLGVAFDTSFAKKFGLSKLTKYSQIDMISSLKLIFWGKIEEGMREAERNIAKAGRASIVPRSLVDETDDPGDARKGGTVFPSLALIQRYNS